MNTTVDTFIYLKRDIEQSFQRLDHSSFRNKQEFDQLVHHLSCTIDDLAEVHRLLLSSVDKNSSVNNFSRSLNDAEAEQTQILLSNSSSTVGFLNSNFLSTHMPTGTFPSADQREEFIRHVKQQLEIFRKKNSWNNEAPMEIIRLDPTIDDDDENRIIIRQDEQIDEIHHSIVSLKNLTKNINSEINDHIRVLDNLDNNMIDSQNHVENLTRQTKMFFLSSDGVAGHTCLFIVAVVLFFLIIVLILFF